VTKSYLGYSLTITQDYETIEFPLFVSEFIELRYTVLVIQREVPEYLWIMNLLDMEGSDSGLFQNTFPTST
jgi:hypothetical protein